MSTAGINVMPSPHPIIKENVANKNSIFVANELRQKPIMPIREPAIITRRFPCCLHKILPNKPMKETENICKSKKYLNKIIQTFFLFLIIILDTYIFFPEKNP